MQYIDTAVDILKRQIAKNASPDDPSEYAFSMIYACASGFNWSVLIEVDHVNTTSYYIRYDSQLDQTTVIRLKAIDTQILPGG